MTGAKGWIVGGMCLVFAVMSGLHAHVFGVGWDYDINFLLVVMFIAGVAIAFLLNFGKSKSRNAITVLLALVLISLSISWGELRTEIMPSTSSKGWGVVWVVMSFLASFAGSLVGLLIRWLLWKRNNGLHKDHSNNN